MHKFEHEITKVKIMTKALTRKLKRGAEVFNTDTGEIARFTATIGTVGKTVFIESMDQDGKFYIWTHEKVEVV
jgi:hypothetical protein